MEQIKQATILILDDDEFNLKLLKKQLALEGYTVRTAASGEEVLAAVAEQLPNLILLDVMMPDLDGFEVTRRLKGLGVRAKEFLSKPVARVELQMRVKNRLKI